MKNFSGDKDLGHLLNVLVQLFNGETQSYGKIRPPRKFQTLSIWLELPIVLA